MDRKIIKNLGVSHINLSWRVTWDHFRTTAILCEAENTSGIRAQFTRFMEINTSFVRNLAANHQIKVFHALPNSIDHVIETGQMDYRFYGSMPLNVFNVAYASDMELDYGEQGLSLGNPAFRSHLSDQQKRVLPATDIVINGHVREATVNEIKRSWIRNHASIHPDKQWWNADSLMFHVNGVFLNPVNIMSTSWATPLALCLANSIKNRLRSEHDFSFEESVFYLRDQIEGKAFDPLYNRQLLSQR